MFLGFANVWTPVVLARKLGTRPMRVVVAGEPIVLFKDQRGGIGALRDRCPHRGASLSLGRVASDGCLECPFHGWRFDRSGAARFIPLDPDAKCEVLSADALPVRQIGDMIWIFTSPGAHNVPEPLPPDSLTDPSLKRTYLERDWACHWTRVMENMLDSPHLPFVHRKTIGRDLRRRLTPQSRMTVEWEDTPYGGRTRASLDDQASAGLMDFFRPNMMVLHIPLPGRRLRMHAIALPTEAGRTRLIIVASRDFARLPIFEPLFQWMNARISQEDRAVVESIGPDEVPPAREERSVATDRATLQFRRYYDRELRGVRA